MNDAAPIKPYEITVPTDVLTPEVQRNLQILFRQLDLAVTDIYAKLPSEQTWKKVEGPLQGAEDDEPPFCAFMRAHESLGVPCARDRNQFLDAVARRTGNGVEVVCCQCPYGMTLQEVSFRVGGALFALRSSGWLERGNEGIAITRTLEQLQAGGLNHLRDNILPLLRKQKTHSEAQLQADARTLQGLIGLVHNQANQIFEGKVQESRDRFFQKLRELLVPLMGEVKTDERNRCVKDALERIRVFFGLTGCAFYFSKLNEPKSLARVAFTGAGSANRELLQTVVDSASPLDEGAAKTLPGGQGLPEGAKISIVRYPLENYSLFAGWPASVESPLLDDHFFEDLTRLLSAPICVAQLGTELGQEAERRMRQSRNTAHTVRSAFQAILGDTHWLRLELNQQFSGVAPSVPVRLSEPLQHLEDGVMHLRNLLRGHEIIEDKELKTSRGIAIKRKKQPLLGPLIKVREALVRRAAELRIDIDLDPSLNALSELDVDTDSISLAFFLLLDNAIKYSHRGTADRHKSILVKGEENSASLHVDISDFGLGIHPAERGRIFQPYQQGSVIDETRSITGQGIGLAAVREIASKHRGDVTLERCIAYRGEVQIPDLEIEEFDPGSRQASALLQHCLVVFRLTLPKN